jgi:hypothetical protein
MFNKKKKQWFTIKIKVKLKFITSMNIENNICNAERIDWITTMNLLLEVILFGMNLLSIQKIYPDQWMCKYFQENNNIDC